MVPVAARRCFGHAGGGGEGLEGAGIFMESFREWAVSYL